MIKEFVNKYDPQNQFDVLVKSYSQVEKAWNTHFENPGFDIKEIKNIVISGLGGSAIGGELLTDFLSDELSIPVSINRNYGLPNFANENTLVIASSYSGNTEETLDAANTALKRGSKIICVTTGGKLYDFAEENNLPVFVMQSGFQPRYALYSSFFALLKVFQTLGLIENQDDFVTEIVELLKNNGEIYSQENNYAQEIAEKLIGFVPIIYGVVNKTGTLAVRLKGQFNENSKSHAFYNLFPEMNHNEIIGWETQNESKLRAKVLIFRDKSYHRQIQKRIEISSALIKKSGTEIIFFESSFDKFKVRLFDLVYLGDWVTYYLAILRKHDPSEIDNIMYLKSKLQD